MNADLKIIFENVAVHYYAPKVNIETIYKKINENKEVAVIHYHAWGIDCNETCRIVSYS